MGKHKSVVPPEQLHVRRKELSAYVELRLQRFLREEIAPAIDKEFDDFAAATEQFLEEMVVRKLTEAGYRVAPAPGMLVDADGAALSATPARIVGLDGEMLSSGVPS